MRKKATNFLNVDLDLYSRSNLEPLVAAFGGRVSVMYVGRHRQMYEAHLELAKMIKNADVVIRGFKDLVETLPPSTKKLWDTAETRDFNIGIQAGMQPHSFELPLAQKTVAICSRLKARIVFTVYAPERRIKNKR